MKAERVYNQILKTSKYLLKELDYYGENQFRQKIAPHQWSIGEIYDYMINGTLSFYIPQIQSCLNATGAEGKGKKRLKGKFVFWYGRIPAIIKYNDLTGYRPVQPESVASTKDMMYRLIKQLNKAAQEIDNTKKQESKTLHQSFGMLNAEEWFMLIDMHLKHFVSVKEKLDKVLRNPNYVWKHNDTQSLSQSNDLS